MLAFAIADNQYITAMGMRSVLTNLFHDCEIGGASCKKELTEFCRKHPQSIIVLDYTLFDFYGVEELLVIGKRFPDVYWLLFSAELSDELLRRLSAEKNIGLLLKDCTESEIHQALHWAVTRKSFRCKEIADRSDYNENRPKEKIQLTPSETEVLRLIAYGKSVKEIAELRHSSAHTIITHKKNIFRKLEVNTVYEATRYALRAGLVEMAEYYI